MRCGFIKLRWTNLSIRQRIIFFLLQLCSPIISAQQNKPLPCTDLGRICTAYLHYIRPSNSSIEDVQNLFSVRSAAIFAEASSSFYTSNTAFQQSLLVKVQCSCSSSAPGKYFAQTTYSPTTNDTTLGFILSKQYEALAWADYDTVPVEQNTSVPISLLCGCSNLEWNYLLSHVVTNADTLLVLASRFNSDVSSIQAVNNMTTDLLYTGLVYFIPINSVVGSNVGSLGSSSAPSQADTSSQGRADFSVSMGIIAGSVVGALLIIIALVVYTRAKFVTNRENKSLIKSKSGERQDPNSILGSFSKYRAEYDKGSNERLSTEGSIRHGSLRKDLMTSVFEVEKPVVFGYEEVCKASENFEKHKLLGQGAYGAVYHGRLRDQEVAIKRMKATSTKEFVAELKVLCKAHHTNLVELIGYCTSEDYLLLVYEYAENRALSDHLHYPLSRGYAPLSWIARVQIALDSARGLEYIHDHTKEHYVHRDIKSSNILLDSAFRAKIADFGLAKLAERTVDGEILATRVVGTFGYLAPEYLREGKATSKSDVYAFGIVLFELLTGKEALSRNKDRLSSVSERRSIVPITLAALKDSTASDITSLQKIADPDLDGMYPAEGLYKMTTLAKECVEEDPLLRPGMKEVVFTLSQILFGSIEWEASLAGTSQNFSGIFQGR